MDAAAGVAAADDGLYEDVLKPSAASWSWIEDPFEAVEAVVVEGAAAVVVEGVDADVAAVEEVVGVAIVVGAVEETAACVPDVLYPKEASWLRTVGLDAAVCEDCT